ncbi:MAG: hypothetical protein AB8H79_14515 [Myxococcota bacterium]
MRTLLFTLVLGACAYDAPVDPNAEGASARVTGTIVVTGLDQAADTMVLIYRADNPPPPV